MPFSTAPNRHLTTPSGMLQGRGTFKVNVFDRAQGVPYGREKEVDVAMAVEITKHACQSDEAEKANTVFIIVTGDRDFTSPVTCTLGFGIRVELWAWKTGMSVEFRRLANKESLLSVQEIDDIADHFSFTAYMSTRVSGDINSARAIVFKDVPSKEKMLYFATTLNCLLRLFHITQIKRSEELKDIVVEFPKSKPEKILEQLKKLNFSYKACSYAEYVSGTTLAKHQPPPLLQTNRYQALGDIDTSNYESTAEAITGSLNITDIDEVITEEDTAEATPADSEASNPDEEDDDGTEWILVVNKKAGAWSRRRKLKQIRCRWEIHCAMALQCKYLHTEHEQEVFSKFPKIKFQYWKVRTCTKEAPHLKEQCRFAHGSADTWCLRCKDWGHCTDDCAG